MRINLKRFERSNGGVPKAVTSGLEVKEQSPIEWMIRMNGSSTKYQVGLTIAALACFGNLVPVPKIRDVRGQLALKRSDEQSRKKSVARAYSDSVGRFTRLWRNSEGFSELY